VYIAAISCVRNPNFNPLLYPGESIYHFPRFKRSPLFPTILCYNKAAELLSAKSAAFWKGVRNKEQVLDFFRHHLRIDCQLRSFKALRHFYGLSKPSGSVTLRQLFFSESNPLSQAFNELVYYENSFKTKYAENGRMAQRANYLLREQVLKDSGYDHHNVRKSIASMTKCNRKPYFNAFRARLEDLKFIQAGLTPESGRALISEISSALEVLPDVSECPSSDTSSTSPKPQSEIAEMEGHLKHRRKSTSSSVL
jgi:hypothetical protein